MLKIMIADDEKAIRESISQCINWEELNLNLTGVYKNGVEAYDAVLNEVPDIIMTDIRMPGMSGLELIEHVSHMNPDTQFIVLSGYSEFAYAQTAMQFGVRHYLLKPCSEQQIIESLKEVIEICCQKRAIHHMTDRQMEFSHTLRQSIFMNILTEAAFHPDHDNHAIYTPYEKLLNFEGPRYLLISVKGISDKNVHSCYKEICDLHQQLAPSIPLHGVYAAEELLLFCQEYSSDNSRSQNHFDKLIADGTITNLTASSLPSLSALMDVILDFSSSNGSVSYVTQDKVFPIFNYSSIFKIITDQCVVLCRLAESSLETDEKKRQASLDAISRQLHSSDNCEFLVQLTSHILFTLANQDHYCSLIEATEMMTELKKYTDADLLRNYFLSWLSEAIKQSPSSASLQGKLVQDIKDYIDANLSNPDLTLKMIAENHLFMNVDYVSKRFFKETGTKFSMYLREVRVQKAKELIASDTSNKLQNIAQHVGLGNSPQYFSQIFKKHTGMTPSAYSKKMHGKN